MQELSVLQRRARRPEQHNVGSEENHDNCARCGPKAAHDLLSPLSTISFLSALIADDYSERLGVDGRELLILLQQSVQHMRAVVESWSHSPGCG